MTEGATPFVTVVLPVRNEAAHLGACLSAVQEQDYPRDRMEILVADGRSTDGTRDLVAERTRLDPRIRLIDNPGRIVPTGLNAAIRACRGGVIVRIDGHTIVERDYVRRGVEALTRTRADVVGGNMSATSRSLFGRAVAMATSTPMGVGGSRFHYSNREEPAETVYMGTFRRDVFDRFGWFDENLVRNQDDEFTYRVRESGGSVFLVPSMMSRYTPRESPAKLLKQYFQYGYYKIRVARLHPRMMRPRHLAPSAFVLLLAFLAASAPASAAAAMALAALFGVHAAAALAFSARPGAADPAAWILVVPATLLLHVGYGAGFIAGSVGLLIGREPGSLRSADGGAA
jgi:glycosyltransferase involved in cell wall biosynthesis